MCNFLDLCCNFEQYTTPVREPCVPACSFEEYQIATTSYSRFPANYVADPGLSSDNSASANIFFGTLTVENQQTEFSYGAEEFLAEIGGQLGLFIGVSVISLFEFLFFLYDAIMYCMMRKPCKARSKSSDIELAQENGSAVMEEKESFS